MIVSVFSSDNVRNGCSLSTSLNAIDEHKRCARINRGAVIVGENNATATAHTYHRVMVSIDIKFPISVTAIDTDCVVCIEAVNGIFAVVDSGIEDVNVSNFVKSINSVVADTTINRSEWNVTVESNLVIAAFAVNINFFTLTRIVNQIVACVCGNCNTSDSSIIANGIVAGSTHHCARNLETGNLSECTGFCGACGNVNTFARGDAFQFNAGVTCSDNEILRAVFVANHFKISGSNTCIIRSIDVQFILFRIEVNNCINSGVSVKFISVADFAVVCPNSVVASASQNRIG